MRLKNNILVVSRQSLQSGIQNIEGYHVYTVGNAPAATLKLQEEVIGAIIIEWAAFYSNLNGFKDWLENPALSMIPIVVVATAGMNENERVELIRSGADYVFVSPFNANELAASIDRLFHRSKQFEQIAFCDALTGVYNRRYFDQQLRIELDRAQRTGSNMSLALIDIDRFKQINDTYGHPFGDVVLQGLGQFLTNNLRPSDFLARLGGEEFAILFPDTKEKDAGEIMRRVLQLINRTSIAILESNPFFITFSCGVVQWREGMTPKQLLEGADAGLYRAKQNGRNRIELLEGKLAEDAVQEKIMKTVLIVDDEEKERATLASSMDENTVKVRTAANGQEALECLSQRNVDLCILDDQMPKTDPLQLLKKIKARPEAKNMKVIMLHSKAKSNEMMRYLNAGADDCISKPVSTIEIEYRVKFLLNL
jgi:two-component system, cell cycle response regulator